MGFESARSLLVTGFRVIIACRSKEKAEAACAALREKPAPRMTIFSPPILDVSSLSSVNTFAEEFLADPSNLSARAHVQRRHYDGTERVTPVGIRLAAGDELSWPFFCSLKNCPREAHCIKACSSDLLLSNRLPPVSAMSIGKILTLAPQKG